MKSYIRTAWVAGLRSRSFQMVFGLGLLLLAGAWLASQFSPRQPQTVALDVGLSGLRFALVLQTLFWVQELVGREIDRRAVVLTLAYPAPRSRYVLGRFCGIALLQAVATLVLGLLLWWMVLMAGGGYESARTVALGLPYWMTVLGLYLDALVVLAFALCLTTVSTVLLLPLALGAIFAMVARGIGPVLDFLLVRGADGDDEMLSRFGPVVRVVRWIIPDLSRLDWRDWTLYNLPPEAAALAWSVVMALGYATLLLALAVIAFSRREFS